LSVQKEAATEAAPESDGQLTLKSIDTHMTEHEANGNLIFFDPPRLADEGYMRRLWLHPEVRDWSSRLGENKKERRYLADVRQVLKGFVIGKNFDDDAILWRLDSEQQIVWEIRVTFAPQWRIFGSFSRPGEFVLANHKSRALLEEEGFAKHIARCERVVGALFPGHPMCTGLSRASLLVEFDYA
jgi:hypothetical protein